MSAWIVSPTHVRHLVAGAVRFGVIEQSQAHETGQMLTRANVRSIRARYGEWDEGAAAVKPFVWIEPAKALSDVSLLKQVRCYAYQTCEYDGFETSPAGTFCDRLEKALNRIGVTTKSPGYDEAPWGL